MCRNIRTLFNFQPPVTDGEIQAAALQFVRKISGFQKPSRANEPAFLAAVDRITAVSRELLQSLETSAPPKDREEEAARARARAARRFGERDGLGTERDVQGTPVATRRPAASHGSHATGSPRKSPGRPEGKSPGRSLSRSPRKSPSVRGGK